MLRGAGLLNVLSHRLTIEGIDRWKDKPDAVRFRARSRELVGGYARAGPIASR